MRLNGLRSVSGVLTPIAGASKGIAASVEHRLAALVVIAALVFGVMLFSSGKAQAEDRTTRVITLLSSGTYTAATGYSTSFDVSAYAEGQIFIDVTTEAGTSTLDVTVEVSPDDSTWYTHTSVAQISATGQYRMAITNFGKYIRVKYVVSGTSFIFSIKGAFKN